MPVLDADPWTMVALNVVVWGGWSVAVGWWAHRRPVADFARDSWLYRRRAVERGGKLYEALHIRRWKDHLPEAGAFFTGGFSKRALRSRDPDMLARFVAETRRAEWTHWVIMAVAPLFVLWNWPWIAPLIALYALVANLPCLLVQRYNRLRLQALLGRIGARGQS